MANKILESLKQLNLNNQSQLNIAPCKALSKYVAKYTVTFFNDMITCDNITLIPDASGCLIFTYDNLECSSLLWGPTTKTFNLHNDMNNYPLQLYIELLPGGLFFLTGCNQIELTDMQIPLELVNNRLNMLVYHAFETADNLSNFIDKINSILLQYFANDTIPQALSSSVENILQHHGCLSVKEIAEKAFYSDRQINRLFKEYLGMNVKTLSSIVRINHILQLMNSNKKQAITTLAHTAGFYDQAHFVHTFKSVCGMTPKVYFNNMSDFYNDLIHF